METTLSLLVKNVFEVFDVSTGRDGKAVWLAAIKRVVQYRYWKSSERTGTRARILEGLQNLGVKNLVEIPDDEDTEDESDLPGTLQESITFLADAYLPSGGYGSGGPHPDGCDCGSCRTHPDGCDCGNCGTHPDGCDCGNCRTHPDNCKCGVCNRSPHPDGCVCGNCGPHPDDCMCGLCGRNDERNKKFLLRLINSSDAKYENIVANQRKVVSFGGGRRPVPEVFASLTNSGLVKMQDGSEVHLRIFRNSVLGKSTKSVSQQVRFRSRQGTTKGFRNI
jgi:hypothetical protein